MRCMYDDWTDLRTRAFYTGTYLNIGTILSAFPITLYALFNHDFGLYR